MRLTARMKTICQSQNRRSSAPQPLELVGTGTRQAPGPSETPSRGSDQCRWRECRRARKKPVRSADILPTAGPLDTRVVLMLEGRVVDLARAVLIHGTPDNSRSYPAFSQGTANLAPRVDNSAVQILVVPDLAAIQAEQP